MPTRSPVPTRVSAVLLAVLLGGLSLLTTGARPAVAAEGPGGFAARGGASPVWLMIRSAGLTPEQQARVREIMRAHRAALGSLRAETRQAQRDLADRLLGPGPVAPADVQASLARIAQARTAMLQEATNAALEIRALLTPEQLRHVAEVKDRMQALRSEMQQLLQSTPQP